MFEQLPISSQEKPKTKRRRGTHSTACKCPTPFYTRPKNYKPLPGELGRAQRNLVVKDKKTGQWFFRRRPSCSPYFVFLRPVVGRQRGFRPERRALLDALFVVMIDTVNLANSIVTINLTMLAERLSPKDEQGNVIPETMVTLSRISRLIDELIQFGILSVPESERSFDHINGVYFPKHVIITEAGWRLTGINLDKLRAEQYERRVAESEGIVSPGEVLSLKASRARWFNKCRLATLVHRRQEALKQKRYKKLSGLPFDDRKYQVANRLLRTITPERLIYMSDLDFEKLVWSELYQLKLGPEVIAAEPDTPPMIIH
ncbi:plasmid replication initiator RepA (plasmid) [Xenorhabdus stockiae]|uniref:plasmid replication initiator RepA n=1 Tax=Xenorhabdus stockiae TaxID=351614 RepID=UPI003CEBEEFA